MNNQLLLGAFFSFLPLPFFLFLFPPLPLPLPPFDPPCFNGSLLRAELGACQRIDGGDEPHIDTRRLPLLE